MASHEEVLSVSTSVLVSPADRTLRKARRSSCFACDLVGVQTRLLQHLSQTMTSSLVIRMNSRQVAL